MDLVAAIILWIHLFSAIIFIGGSYFMWLVLVPESYKVSKEEGERTRMLGVFARRFALITNVTLILLILTGLYNATWYLGSIDLLTKSFRGFLLLIKASLTLLLIILVYINGVYFGRKITKLASQRRFDDLKRIRKISKTISLVNLALMLMITVVASMMQFAA